MAETINMDKTVEQLLYKYAEHCKRVLENEKTRIDKTKCYTEQDVLSAFLEYNKAKVSYEFLLIIAQNPKKYLYTKNDIFYTDLDNGRTVYQMLESLTFPKYCGDKNVLIALSNELIKIASDPRRNEKWVYVPGCFDREAEAVLELNKYVSLMDENVFIKTVKGLVGKSHFAISMYGKQK